MYGLTKRQQEILRFIQEEMQQKAIAPSYREIGNHFGLKSLGSIYRFIQALQKKGYLTYQKHGPRSLTMTTRSEEESTLIPYIGHVRAGFPLETFATPPMMSVPSILVAHAEQAYLLQVLGEGFLEEQIAPKDFLIIEARAHANPGEMVLALVGGHDMLLKRYFEEDSFVRLEATNPSYRPIIVRKENIQVQGVLTGVFRSFI